MLAVGMTLAVRSADAAVVGRIEGFSIESMTQVSDQTLLLIGAGAKTRGKNKTDVVSLYLPRPARSVEEAAMMPGAKRVSFIMLMDLNGRQLEKIFSKNVGRLLNAGEVGELIHELVAMGRAYQAMGHLRRGDRIDMDWVPGRGMSTQINGAPLEFGKENGRSVIHINKPLLYDALLRVYLEPDRPGEFLDNIFARSRSMMASS